MNKVISVPLGAMLLAAACGLGDVATPAVEDVAEGTPPQPDEVHQLPSLTSIRTAITDDQGRPVGIRCMSCHSLRPEHHLPDHSPEPLKQVHAGMVYLHGALKCRACHDPERPDRLRLADGTSLELADALRLCSQCHGPQATDWEAGSHGGMRGYWDRRRGQTVRNHCVDCHDPHNPQFPIFLPAPPPRDRFLAAEGDHNE